MLIKAVFLLFSFLIVTNLVLIFINLIFNINLYKKYGRIIAVFSGLIILFIAAVCITFSLLGFI